ncbi:MAG: hypothetical protein KY459_16030 [Acidobacteria bacterium]|nr:hypothetical protein [Acidobacteriota bacterium]
MAGTSDERPRGRFETTRWSIVVAAGDRDGRAAEEALAQLCSTYWYPVFAFIRRKGHRPEDAEDLTQAFFARLIEKDWISDADRNRGRFRTFLLTACQRFLSDERDRTRAIKRGGAATMIPIDTDSAERRLARSLSHSETPEHLFDRQWCLTLLDSVLREVRHSYAVKGNEHLFGIRPEFSPPRCEVRSAVEHHSCLTRWGQS